MKIFPIALVALFVNGCRSISLVEKRNKEAVRKMLKAWEVPRADINEIEKTHATSYVQHVDGKTLYFDEYLAHHKKLLGLTSNITINIEHMVAKDNKVATVHRALVTKKDGEQLRVKVVALFEFDDNGKLILCDELTRLEEGNERDRDLGSRQ